MKKYLLFLMMPLLANACFTHDDAYYRGHVTALQKAIYHCPDAHPKGVTCGQLQAIASRINDLSDELRDSPQGFGQRIMALQLALDSHADVNDATQSLAQEKIELNERLAVVKWLESPRT